MQQVLEQKVDLPHLSEIQRKTLYSINEITSLSTLKQAVEEVRTTKFLMEPRIPEIAHTPLQQYQEYIQEINALENHNNSVVSNRRTLKSFEEMHEYLLANNAANEFYQKQFEECTYDAPITHIESKGGMQLLINIRWDNGGELSRLNQILNTPSLLPKLP